MIRAKEALEAAELRAKAELRTVQNEAQDLRFLVDQKDVRAKQQDRRLHGLREKLDEALSKLYMPSQDEVIQGLGQKMGEHNVVKGQQQF